MDGKINIDDLMTHTMSLKDVNHAFDLMREGQIDPLGGSVLIDHL